MSDKQSVDTKHVDGEEEICCKCKKIIKSSTSFLRCGLCSTRFHPKCGGISNALLNYLDTNEAVHWYCVVCNPVALNFLKVVGDMKSKLEICLPNDVDVCAVSNQVSAVSEKLGMIEEKLDKLDNMWNESVQTSNIDLNGVNDKLSEVDLLSDKLNNMQEKLEQLENTDF